MVDLRLGLNLFNCFLFSPLGYPHMNFSSDQLKSRHWFTSSRENSKDVHNYTQASNEEKCKAVEYKSFVDLTKTSKIDCLLLIIKFLVRFVLIIWINIHVQ